MWDKVKRESINRSVSRESFSEKNQMRYFNRSLDIRGQADDNESFNTINRKEKPCVINIIDDDMQ